MNHDVVIVGGGPAGSLAAYTLAKGGLDVLVLEKEQFPRYKACGGGLSLKAQKMIPFEISRAVEFHSAGGIVAYAGKPIFRARTRVPFAALVMRDQFDNFLIQKAVEAGATLETDCRVGGVEQHPEKIMVRTTKGQCWGRAVIGADGVNSVVANVCGLMKDRRAGTALEMEVNVPLSALNVQGTYATFDFGAIPHGYGWVFPKNDHLSIGVFSAQTAKSPQLRTILEEYIASLAHVNEYEMMRVRGHRIPLGGSRDVLHAGNVLLAGDAANMADPFLGEGIYYALWSGKIAAEVLLAQWQHLALDLSQYTQRIHQEILPHFQYAEKLANLIYRIPKLSTHLLRRSETMQKILFGIIAGDNSYQQLFDWVHARPLELAVEVLLHPYRGGGV